MKNKDKEFVQVLCARFSGELNSTYVCLLLSFGIVGLF